MPDENLVKYIKDGLAQGRSEDVIRPLLVSNGWAQKDIDDAFVFVKTGQTISASVSPQSASSPQITTPTGSIVGMSNHEGMRTRTKVILWILGVIVVLGAISGVVWMIYGKTISSMITVQYLVRENGTLLNVAPTPHVLAPITPATSTTFSYLGLTLSAPWAGVSSTKEEGTVAVQVSFTNGKQFLIMKASEPNPADVDSLYSVLHVSTDYDLETAAFNAVPSQVSIMTPGNEAILTTLLLIYKTTIFIPATRSLYSFDTGTIKGFQHGDPIPGQWTLIEVYDQAGDKFTLSTMNATQGEIDYLLASVASSTSTPLTSVSSTEATATVGNTSSTASWITFTPSSGDFSVKMPGPPQEESYTSSSTQSLDLFTSSGASGTAYAIGDATYLPSLSSSSIKEIFLQSVAELVASRKGNVLVASVTSTADGYPVITFQIKNNEYLPNATVYMQGNYILVGNKAYEQEVIYNAQNRNDGAYNEFIDSFIFYPKDPALSTSTAYQNCSSSTAEIETETDGTNSNTSSTFQPSYASYYVPQQDGCYLVETLKPYYVNNAKISNSMAHSETVIDAASPPGKTLFGCDWYTSASGTQVTTSSCYYFPSDNTMATMTWSEYLTLKQQDLGVGVQ
jgi:hypothetical protein